ncbi:hypothetical protein [Piscirickettsia litoralis]|uniref:Uncharacterized protein n=1 Tax=Piscirickettsia litoralis TaxID=1891921 RepID=A0ABX3A4B3_9GAMM|nr:hypothetical protein [Piscirickettsia litoralis]ODN42488.1 hypothetical protein BGC07_05550 [Piscirickettsia litoralis]
MKLINKTLIKSAVLILISVLAIVTSAYAGKDTGAATVTALFNGWKATLLNVLVFIEFVSGFGGVILIVMGLFQLRSGHSGQGGGQQVQTKSGFIYMTLGGSLLVVGTIAGVLGNSANGGVSASVESTLNAYGFTNTNPNS